MTYTIRIRKQPNTVDCWDVVYWNCTLHYCTIHDALEKANQLAADERKRGSNITIKVY